VLNKTTDKRKSKIAGGFTLLELIITLTVLGILVMGTIPLTQNAVKRQKEIKLRQTLRDLRNAIDEFKRDTHGACPLGSITSGNPTNRQTGQNIPADPRSRVVIDDCTIFTTDNVDRYPPSLDILAEGVRVKPRGLTASITGGRGLGDDEVGATDLNDTKEIIKHYLREIPIDPMTGEAEWDLRSSYQSDDAGNWDDINVFDVRSTSDEEALNGEKYSDW
jgi:general secretion pathway protein G